MTRPLSSAKVEATGKSYSDHEALEVDLELSISDNQKNNTEKESKERVSCKNNYVSKYMKCQNTGSFLLRQVCKVYDI